MNTRIPEQYVRAGKIAREVRQWILGNVRAGSGLLDVAEKMEAEIVRRGGQPAFPTGMGVNEVTAHYAPQEDERGVIQETDVVKIDYGVHIDGYIADTSITITENPQYQSLLEATEKALQAAIDVVKRDRRIGEIGKAISSSAERDGLQADKQPERPHGRAVPGPRGEEHTEPLRPKPADAEERRRLRHRAFPYAPRRSGLRRRGAAGEHILTDSQAEDGQQGARRS